MLGVVFNPLLVLTLLHKIRVDQSPRDHLDVLQLVLWLPILDRQFKVKVMVRSPEKLSEFGDKIEIVRGDYFDKNILSVAVKDFNVVISTIGPPENRKNELTPENFRQALKSLVEIMNDLNVQRFINLASTGTSFEGEEINFPRRCYGESGL